MNTYNFNDLLHLAVNIHTKSFAFLRLLQYFIGVTLLAMVPELPEIVNGIQFALQNNISLR